MIKHFIQEKRIKIEFLLKIVTIHRTGSRIETIIKNQI